jgi:molybdopterin/thiamine biosynthesis adenylyltransferase
MDPTPDSTFVIVGAGGLGTPIALALAPSGGRLVLVDDDVVDLSNLPRQVLYGTADVGQKKVLVARRALLDRGVPADRVEAVNARFDESTAVALLHDATVVIDGSDSPTGKFFVNDVARARGVHAVIAGVIRDRGNVFPVRSDGGPCYRCLFEDAPEAESCAEAGVLSPRCGQVAALAARVALALANDYAREAVLTERIWVFDDGAPAPRALTVRPRPGCPTCSPSALEVTA